MKKGGIEGLVIIAIILFVIFKIIVPKFKDGAGNQILTFQALSDLETAIKDIRQYNMKYGNLTQIGLMTSAQGFENSNDRLEIGKSYLYGIKKPDGTAYWCATFEIKPDGNENYIFVNGTSDNSPECNEFTRNPKFSQLRKTKLNY